MNRFRWIPVSAALAVALSVAAPSALAQAKPKHESNTAKKLGHRLYKGTKKAAQAAKYGVRKGGENVSIETHRALGRNSVRINRGPKKDEVITPKGKHVPIKRTK